MLVSEHSDGEIIARIDDVAPRTESQRQRDAYVKLQRLASLPGTKLTRVFEVTDRADDLEAEIHLQDAILRDRMAQLRKYLAAEKAAGWESVPIASVEVYLGVNGSAA